MPREVNGMYQHGLVTLIFALQQATGNYFSSLAQELGSSLKQLKDITHSSAKNEEVDIQQLLANYDTNFETFCKLFGDTLVNYIQEQIKAS